MASNQLNKTGSSVSAQEQALKMESASAGCGSPGSGQCLLSYEKQLLFIKDLLLWHKVVPYHTSHAERGERTVNALPCVYTGAYHICHISQGFGPKLFFWLLLFLSSTV